MTRSTDRETKFAQRTKCVDYTEPAHTRWSGYKHHIHNLKGSCSSHVSGVYPVRSSCHVSASCVDKAAAQRRASQVACGATNRKERCTPEATSPICCCKRFLNARGIPMHVVYQYPCSAPFGTISNGIPLAREWHPPDMHVFDRHVSAEMHAQLMPVHGITYGNDVSRATGVPTPLLPWQGPQPPHRTTLQGSDSHCAQASRARPHVWWYSNN